MDKIFKVEFLRYQVAYCYVKAPSREVALDTAEKKMLEKDNRIITEANFSDFEAMESEEVSGISEEEAIRINALYIESVDSKEFMDVLEFSDESEESNFDSVLQKAVKNRVVSQPQNGIYFPEESYLLPLLHKCCGSHGGNHRRHCQMPEAIETRKQQREKTKKYHEEKMKNHI